MRGIWVFIGISAFMLCAGLEHAAFADQPEPIQLGEMHTIESKILGEKREVLIYAPEGYKTARKKYPIIYLTDAASHYLHVITTMKFLRRNSKMPQMIVVGVTNTDRTRDLTPPITEQMFDSNGEPVPERPTAGGADNFLTFFEKELFPYVEDNYPTAPYRLLAGHSLGGLFTIHTFVNHNDMFQGYMAASPSLWWNNGKLVAKAAAFLKNNKTSENSLFVSMGNEGGDMFSNYQNFVDVLNNGAGKNLHWSAQHMPKETHGSVVLRSYYQGLETIFDDWYVPDETMTAGLTAIKTHFARLSQRMGYTVDPSPTIINTSGFKALNAGKTRDAIEILSYNADRFPDAPDVQDSLGAAYEADGQLKEAQAQYRKAVDLAEKQQSGGLEFFKTQYKNITEKISQNHE